MSATLVEHLPSAFWLPVNVAWRAVQSADMNAWWLVDPASVGVWTSLVWADLKVHLLQLFVPCQQEGG